MMNGVKTWGKRLSERTTMSLEFENQVYKNENELRRLRCYLESTLFFLGWECVFIAKRLAKYVSVAVTSSTTLCCRCLEVYFRTVCPVVLAENVRWLEFESAYLSAQVVGYKY